MFTVVFSILLAVMTGMAAGIVLKDKAWMGITISASSIVAGILAMAMLGQPWFMFTMATFLIIIGIVLGYLLAKATRKAGLIVACVIFLVAVIIATAFIGVTPGEKSPKGTPTEVPTEVATEVPTEVPTEVATEVPTEVPTEVATETPDPTSCTPARVVSITSGLVRDNLDSGDGWTGTILMASNGERETVFVIDTGLWIDLEDPSIQFSAIRFQGSLEEGICLSGTMYPEIETFVVTNGSIPEGSKSWTEWGDQWMEKISVEEYIDSPIGVNGFTTSDPIFLPLSETETKLATDDEIVYGQFWKPGSATVHVQIRPEQTLTIPSGYQGTYWVWTGEGAENSLQARFLQASYEVSYRDSTDPILLACGQMPAEIEEVYSLYSATFDKAWQSNLDGWVCEP